jgi:hypothetical protein
MHAGTVPGMAVGLTQLDAHQPMPQNFAIEVVEDTKTLNAWATVAAVGSGFPPPVPAMLNRLEQDVGLRSGPALRRYLGYLNGLPVASASMVLHAGVAGIYAVATLAEARRQGIGAAMTRIPLLDALAEGYKVGTLQASEMGYPVYRRLGFKDVCGIELYLLSVESADNK